MTKLFCRAGLQINSETYENLAPCMSTRQYKDPPVIFMKRGEELADFRSGFAWDNAGAYTLKLRHTGSENIGGGQGAMVTTNVSCTLATNKDQTIFQKGVDMLDYVVRRLMPIECERLQGFPDNWTRIEWKGKPEEDCPDTRRYQACGNSMAVPVMKWIGERIEKVDSN